jgi:hypothetical protein
MQQQFRSRISAWHGRLGIIADATAIRVKANLRNLAKKVHEGKTLSASECNLLESAPLVSSRAESQPM